LLVYYLADKATYFRASRKIVIFEMLV
jgi:hypothetical protein